MAVPRAAFSKPTVVLGRLTGYGYRYGEIRLPRIPVMTPLCKFSKFARVDLEVRPPVLVSLGCPVFGNALPHPDPWDPVTTAAGVRKRFAMNPPPIDLSLLEEFRVFVHRRVRELFDRLPSDVDLTVDTWLENTNYPLWRKNELRRAFSQIDNPLDRKWKLVKSFMKDECYPEYKHARAINSRTDQYKCMVGPAFKAMEHLVYKHPFFIKHVPVKDRAQYVRDLLYQEGAKYFVSDYSAFESLFVKDLQEACEFQLYEYLLENVDGGSNILSLMRETQLGLNQIQFKNFSMRIPAKRMSGEMNTSLGNGFSNFMFMDFMCMKKGCRNLVGVVEGDDGLFRADGDLPTESDFARLGLIIKAETHLSLETASFCGLIFDVEDRINIVDPLETIVSTGWTNNRYASSTDMKLKRLLRCKALSLAHQYPGCPLVSSFAWYILRCTRGLDAGNILASYGSLWERDQLLAAVADESNILRRTPSLRTRFLMEDLYNIPVHHQLAIENYFDSLDRIQVVDHPFLQLHCKSDWSHYWDNYVLVPQDMRRPGMWPQLKDFVQEFPVEFRDSSWPESLDST